MIEIKIAKKCHKNYTKPMARPMRALGIIRTYSIDYQAPRKLLESKKDGGFNLTFKQCEKIDTKETPEMQAIFLHEISM